LVDDGELVVLDRVVELVGDEAALTTVTDDG
jgi:hypothetical protein